MKIGKLNQVILFVRDIHEVTLFYRDMLGFEVESPPDLDDFHQEIWVVLDCGPCKLALHSGGKGRLAEDSPKLVFRVKNIHQVRKDLIARGLQLGELRPILGGLTFCNGEDPEGNRFSLEGEDV